LPAEFPGSPPAPQIVPRQREEKVLNNPLLCEWSTAFQLPPFELIDARHFPPAFEAVVAGFESRVAAIADCAEPADFSNTIEALELADADLRRVYGVFSNLAASDTNSELKAIERSWEPRLAGLRSAVWTHQGLYARVRQVAHQAGQLPAEQAYLLEELQRRFRRAGADLAPEQREKVLAIDLRLAELCTTFEQNVRDDAQEYALVLKAPEELAGLPRSVLAAAAAEAGRRGLGDSYVFTISRSSITPLLQYAASRELRQQIYEAYTRCGDNSNAYNNRAIVREIVNLRLRRATLLGFASHAEYMLDDRMARHPGAVRELLDRVWAPARERLHREARDLRHIAGDEIDELRPWDWWYYTEKLRAQRFDLDPAEVRAYFPLEQVLAGAFEVVERLYGVHFRALESERGYHPDVRLFEVLDGSGGHLGVFMTDYYQRASKGAGAWMNEFRGAHGLSGGVRPVVVNCCNFSRGDPTLLDMDEVRTLFHELGHGLHGLLTRAPYPSLAGTRVKQDFVELPSQIMEHWARQPDVLKRYARHYQTGAPIPDALIEKLAASEQFNQGFASAEYLAACYLDLAWHELETEFDGDIEDFELAVMQEMGLDAPIAPRYRSTYFKHIFAGDYYSAGYYVYLWAEQLDADAFDAFLDQGIFDPATASRFRQCILEKGGGADPMSLYRAFRGRDPDPASLLRQRGLLADAG
jgi:peptidyl-dipeptidase Dcp